MDSPFQDITDLEGKKVCGSSKSSTSGNLMPSAMMKQKGIDKETFFQGGMQFPGSHDKAAQAVIDGEFDGCFINEATFNKFNKDEKVLRSLWRHDAVPEFPFNVNLDAVPQDILNRVKDALFKMHITDLDGVKASNPKYDRWVPIELSDYAGAKAAIDDVYAGKNFYNLDLWGKT
jgi:phosphonate transport system substrate-binding protein